MQVCAVVGGMARSKQERLLSQRPSIVVGTVGRIWMLMNEVRNGEGRVRALERGGKLFFSFPPTVGDLPSLTGPDYKAMTVLPLNWFSVVVELH